VDVLERNRVTDVLGVDNIYPTQIMAIAGIYARAHTGSSETDCPLRGLVPRITELSLHDSGTLREADQHNLRLCRHIGVLRFDGSLALFSRKAIQSEFIGWAKKRSTVQNVVFVASRLEDLDATAGENLLALVEAVRDAGYRVAFAGFSDRAFEAIARRGVADAIGLDSFYHSAAQALADLFALAHAEDPDEDCPLRGMVPRLVELSLHRDGSLRDARRRGLAVCQRIVAVRLDGPLNFATFGFFETELRAALARRSSATHILFAGHTLAGLDPIAAEQLPRLFEQLRREGYKVVVSGLKDEELDLLSRTDQGETAGADAIFPTQSKAIESIHAEAHRDSEERACPLIEVVVAGEGMKGEE
jgi:MFS superfamily sulfate permease-like transporter